MPFSAVDLALASVQDAPLIEDACLAPRDAGPSKYGDYSMLEPSVDRANGKQATDAGALGWGFVGAPLIAQDERPPASPSPDRGAVVDCLRAAGRGQVLRAADVGTRRYPRSVRAIRWLLAAMLAGTAVLLGTAAALRPYADNQRNWMVIGALLAGLVLAALLFARFLRAAVRAIAEQKPRE